jgi:hypothetical protein
MISDGNIFHMSLMGCWLCENALAEALTTRDFGEGAVFGHLAVFGGLFRLERLLMRIPAALSGSSSGYGHMSTASPRFSDHRNSADRSATMWSIRWLFQDCRVPLRAFTHRFPQRFEPSQDRHEGQVPTRPIVMGCWEALLHATSADRKTELRFPQRVAVVEGGANDWLPPRGRSQAGGAILAIVARSR